MKVKYLLFYIVISLDAQRAWICAPVADLIGQRMSSISAIKPITGYKQMPHYGKGGWACPRIGQALFGQEVELEKIDGDEALISIKNLFYESQGKKRNKYWTLKKNIISQKVLKKAQIDIQKLPAPIDFTLLSMSALRNTLTLIEPWNSYSVGTRFVHIPYQDTKTSYSAWIFNPKEMSMKKTQIPKNLCMVTTPVHGEQSEKTCRTTEEKRQCFVNLLKQWAHRKNGFIPYVWGGFSIRSTCIQDVFILDKKNDEIKEEIRAQRPEKQQEYPKSGLDCSGLIALAAQCCGLPYFYKNTTTIGNHLPSIQQSEKIQPGDIIWFRGHVLVISSLDPAMIIESRGYTLKGYTPGCGKVHEIPLEKAFKGINSIEGLRNTFFQKKPVHRIDGYGKTQTIYGWRILKLL